MRNFRKSRGQAIPMLALAMGVLVGAASLATDVGSYYYAWYRIQQGADAAVLSGGSWLPAYPDLALSTATTYANSNGINNSEIVSTTVAANNQSLTMSVQRNVNFTFARVLGISSATVAASATAQVLGVGKADGAAPFGIDYNTPRVKGELVTLHEGFAPGDWDPLALAGTGASTYLNNIENGCSGTVSIGDLIPLEPGNMMGPTQTGINYRISQGESLYPSGTFADHQLNDPRVILVPMVDFSGVSGRSTDVPVKGFAQLWVSGVDASGDISTYFIDQTAAGTQAQAGVDSYGTYKPVLTQ